ncbi:putative peptidase family-domain-containing protein [Cercophora samala]|uniref:Peptidase family-domain-containing protein n=1 Tax=Cercophora samala TaxID=330535 RepID=A0AA39ZDC5_9PEZI|nr:putative peptidase family-domain-containing protein [Cercophora samala]
MIEIENAEIDEVEEVHQRSFLLSGKCVASAEPASTTDGDFVVVEPKETSFVLVHVEDEHGKTVFPDQRWPLSLGHFKALVLLSPGLNKILVSSGEDATNKVELSLRYTPLLQVPPLHLAILVAKDSPLLMDCPPAKFGEISSTHSSLNAAISKLRVAAYMWQALAADNFYWKGLPRQSFRIEEEYAPDTLSRYSQQRSFGKQQVMGSVPRIHVIRTDKTVAQLRDVDAESGLKHDQEHRHKDLYKIMSKAVKNSEGPLHPNNKPVVAALLLDAHFDRKVGRALPDALFSMHKTDGLSLAMSGSQSTYSWPRFIDEIPDCLLDATPVGDTVSSERSEQSLCMWEACSLSQGRFYKEIIRAFNPLSTKPDFVTTDSLRYGLHQSPWGFFQWPMLFLSRALPCASDKEEKDPKPIRADLVQSSYYQIHMNDALVLRDSAPQFQLPGYITLPEDAPSIKPLVEDTADGSAAQNVQIRCEAGLANVWICSKNVSIEDGLTYPGEPLKCVTYSLHELIERLRPHVSEEERLATGGLDRIEALGMNGKKSTFHGISSWIRLAVAELPLWYIDAAIPGTNLRFTKTAVDSKDDEKDPTRGWGMNHDWKWTVLLKKRSKRKGTKWDGAIVNATMIDVRVGNELDGAYVYYEDGSKVPCGPCFQYSRQMGGHQARKMAIPLGVEVTKVAVSKPLAGDRNRLSGLRVWLSNGQARGALNIQRLSANWDLYDVKVLEPPANHKIVGFYGTSESGGMCQKFGILSVPRDVELPDSVYDMEQFQNLPLDHYAENQGEGTESQGDLNAMDEDVEEDPDIGYDEEWDERTRKIYGK